jgi:hypothetical protein
VLYLSESPVVPGRRVPAAVRTARAVRAESWVLRLACYAANAATVTSGDDRESEEHRRRRMELRERFEGLPGEVPRLAPNTIHGMCLYREQFGPEGEPGEGPQGETLLPVVIAVPTGAPPTEIDSDFPITWVLEVKAKVFPASFVADFELPVFEADEGEIRTPDRRGT